MVEDRFAKIAKLRVLKGSARYTGLLIAPAEGFGRGFFCPSGKKLAFYAVFAYFRPILVFGSNLSGLK